MKISIESLSPVQKKMNVEIPPERVAEEMEKSYRTFQSRARLKGFRTGKVPRPLLERHFGEQIAAEVSSLLVEESYARALTEHTMQVISQPQIVAEKLIPGHPFRYSATVEIRPEISIRDYEEVEVERQVREVEEGEVEQALVRLAESFAQLHPVTDRDQVEQGDMVIIDYVAFQKGKPVAGLQGKGQLVEIGKETTLSGFQEHLVGAHRGGTLEFSLPPSDTGTPLDQPKELTTFRVAVRDIARKEVPLLDDEFAKDHGECATLQELREKVRDNLQKAADRQVERQMEDELITQLLIRNPFEVPPSLVRDQAQRMLIESGIRRSGEDSTTSEDAIPASLRDELTARARKQVQAVFLLDALAKQLALSVSDEELHQHVAELVATVGPERRPQIEAFYAKAENLQALQNRLLHEKALRHLVDRAKIKPMEKGVAGEKEKG